MVSITAVIPTFNRAELVPRAVESILGQTHPATELLVVDDGSTDATRSALAPYDSRLRYIFQPNSGVASAANNGVHNAVSDWVAFLGSDDMWVSDHLERMAAAIEATDGSAPVYFDDLRAEGAAQTTWTLGGFSIAGDYEYAQDASEWYMRELQPMTAQATVYRRDALLEVGGFDESMRSREDTYMYFLLGLGKPACAVAGVGAVMTDAAEDSRLTSIHHPMSRCYVDDTVKLYENVLRNCAPIGTRHRRVLRQRLAAAYWTRARLDSREARRTSCIASALHSVVIAPSIALSRIGHWASKGQPDPLPYHLYHHPKPHVAGELIHSDEEHVGAAR